MQLAKLKKLKLWQLYLLIIFPLQQAVAKFLDLYS